MLDFRIGQFGGLGRLFLSCPAARIAVHGKVPRLIERKATYIKVPYPNHCRTDLKFRDLARFPDRDGLQPARSHQ
jgi:hypothetical protein